MSLPVVSKPTFCVEWQHNNARNDSADADVDMVFLAFNAYGQLSKACFDAHSLPGIKHSGDVTGEKEGKNDKKSDSLKKESTTLDFALVPANVQFIVVAVTAVLHGTQQRAELEPLSHSLSDLSIYSTEFGYRCSLLQLLQMQQNAGKARNFVPLVCVRRGTSLLFDIFQCNFVDQSPAQKGGIADVWQVAESIVRGYVDATTWSQVVHSNVELLHLKKKQSVPFSRFDALSFFGLGWSRGDITGEFDADLHVFSLGPKGVIDHVYFNAKQSSDGAFLLSGDDRTGDGDDKDDDEQMFVKLERIDRRVNSVFIVVQIYTGQTFKQLKNEFCRAVDTKGREIVRFSLDKDAKFDRASAAVMCMLSRDAKDDTWSMRAIGEPIMREQVATNEKAFETLTNIVLQMEKAQQ